jgi:hypothetical protein
MPGKQYQKFGLEGELQNLVAGWSFQSQRIRRLEKELFIGVEKNGTSKRI